MHRRRRHACTRRSQTLVKKYPGKAKEVRGRGLLLGLAVDGDATPYVARAREQGVLLSVAGGTVVRFVPPFIVSDEEIDEAWPRSTTRSPADRTREETRSAVVVGSRRRRDLAR